MNIEERVLMTSLVSTLAKVARELPAYHECQEPVSQLVTEATDMLRDTAQDELAAIKRGHMELITGRLTG